MNMCSIMNDIEWETQKVRRERRRERERNEGELADINKEGWGERKLEGNMFSRQTVIYTCAFRRMYCGGRNVPILVWLSTSLSLRNHTNLSADILELTNGARSPAYCPSLRLTKCYLSYYTCMYACLCMYRLLIVNRNYRSCGSWRWHAEHKCRSFERKYVLKRTFLILRLPTSFLF